MVSALATVIVTFWYSQSIKGEQYNLLRKVGSQFFETIATEDQHTAKRSFDNWEKAAARLSHLGLLPEAIARVKSLSECGNFVRERGGPHLEKTVYWELPSQTKFNSCGLRWHSYNQPSY